MAKTEEKLELVRAMRTQVQDGHWAKGHFSSYFGEGRWAGCLIGQAMTASGAVSPGERITREMLLERRYATQRAVMEDLARDPVVAAWAWRQPPSDPVSDHPGRAAEMWNDRQEGARNAQDVVALLDRQEARYQEALYGTPLARIRRTLRRRRGAQEVITHRGDDFNMAAEEAVGAEGGGGRWADR